MPSRAVYTQPIPEDGKVIADAVAFVKITDDAAPGEIRGQ